jgi:hypothetical protein
MGTTRLDLRDHGAEDRTAIDLLRNVVALVALPLEPSGRPAADRRRVACPHPADVAREPPVGREPDCRRARQARLARLAAHGREVPPEALGAWPRWIVEDLSPEPRLRGMVLRLLHGGHRALPDPFTRSSSSPSSAPRDRPRGCHRAPDGRVGRAAHGRAVGDAPVVTLYRWLAQGVRASPLGVRGQAMGPDRAAEGIARA